MLRQAYNAAEDEGSRWTRSGDPHDAAYRNSRCVFGEEVLVASNQMVRRGVIIATTVLWCDERYAITTDMSNLGEGFPDYEQTSLVQHSRNQQEFTMSHVLFILHNN